jgi:transcriptional regulator with XRE-family HTH domain
MTNQTKPAAHSQPGSIIREYRLQSGFSQEELAERTQLSTRTIQRIENGETQPRGDSLKRVAEVLGVTIEDLQPSLSVGQASAPLLKTDRSYLTLLTLSPLAVLLFPLLGLAAPLTLWLMKRETIADVQEVGRQIVNFQITWLLVLAVGTALFWYQPFFHTEVDWLLSPLQYAYLLYALYAWNIFRTIVNMIRVGRSKPVMFGLAILFIRA